MNYHFESNLEYGTHYINVPAEKGVLPINWEFYGFHFTSYASVGLSIELLKYRYMMTEFELVPFTFSIYVV